MKKYFEYPLDDNVKKRILDFYEDLSVDMHTSQTKRKMKIKVERILNEIHFNGKDSILDVGCSSGELLKILHSNIEKGIGIDIASSVIDKNNKENQYSNIIYEVFDGIHIKLKEKVDKVFMLDVLEHAFEPDALIDSVYNTIRGGGYLTLEVPTTGWLSELVFGSYHMGHLRYYDPNSIKKFLEHHGFCIKSVSIYNAVPGGVYMLKHGSGIYHFMDKVCGMIPAKLYPYYGSILVICQK